MAIQIKEDSLNSNILQSGIGVPSHLADIGTLFTDRSNGTIYVNKDGAVFWTNLSSSGVTGAISSFSYNPTNNTFTVSDTTGSYTATISNVSGLTVSGAFSSSGTTRLANSGANKILLGATPTIGSFSAGTIPDGLTINSDSGGVSFFRPTDYAQMTAMRAIDGSTLRIGGGNQNFVDIWGHTTAIARFTNTSGGRLGILTTSPQFTLDVSGDTRIVSGLTATTISATSYSNLPNTLYTGNGTLSGNRVVNIGSNSLRFSSSTQPNLLVIDGGNQVGIGISSPTWKFEVSNTGNTNVIKANQNTNQTNINSVNAIIGVNNENTTLNTYSLLSFQHADTGVARIGSRLISTAGGSGNYAGDMTFQVKNGSVFLEGIYIRNDGFVGMGTTSPSFKLDVSGDTRVSSGLTVGGNLIVSGNTTLGDATTDTITLSANSITLGSGNGTLNVDSNTFYVDGSSNRVGIGTSSPKTSLDVSGTTSSISFTGTSNTISGTNGAVIMSGGSTTALITVSGSGTVGGSGYTDFIRITNTFSGATNPNKTIRVSNTGGIEFLNNAYTAVTLSLSDNGILFIGGGNLATTSNTDGVTNYLSLGNNNTQIYDDGNTHIHSRGANQVMWINTNGGGINIGTQSPVLGGSVASSINCGTGSVTGYFNINTGRTFTDSRAYGFLTTGGAGTYPGGSQSVTVSLYATSRIWGQEIDAFSDERMKDIQGEVTLDDGLKLVNNLKPIKYTWKDGEDKGLKVGYSAQQVSKAGFDHLVALMPREGLEETIDDDGFVSPKGTQFSMNYDQVTPYHGVVLKHLLERIEQLEKEIKELKAK